MKTIKFAVYALLGVFAANDEIEKKELDLINSENEIGEHFEILFAEEAVG